MQWLETVACSSGASLWGPQSTKHCYDLPVGDCLCLQSLRFVEWRNVGQSVALTFTKEHLQPSWRIISFSPFPPQVTEESTNDLGIVICCWFGQDNYTTKHIQKLIKLLLMMTFWVSSSQIYKLLNICAFVPCLNLGSWGPTFFLSCSKLPMMQGMMFGQQ